jgi:hypothetical protein
MTEAPRKQLDAIDLLMQDHRELESMFREFEYLHARDEDAGHVVDAACAEIRTHDTLKSELFCPAVSEAVNEADMEDLLAQVEEGHQAIRELIARVEQADDDQAKRDEQFSLLSERVERQFELAESQVFPRARRAARLDLASVSDRMKARRNELTQQL